MKEKAASKSTNWNLRVMASRPPASCQSGRRLRATFSSSIVNFAIGTLQFIVLFDTVQAAVAGQLAGIKVKRADRKFGAGIKRVIGQPVQQPGLVRIAQPRHGDMRSELM